MILAALLMAVAPPAACTPIDHDRIYARDLATTAPVFAPLSPDIEIGFAPAPGQQRVFRAAELRRIAQVNHVNANLSSDVCFAWRMEVPSRASILAAVQESLKGRGAHVEIVTQSLSAAPIGPIEFPLAGLCGFAAGPVMWRGYVAYGLNHRFPIWARVDVSVRESRLVTTEVLRSGVPVTANQLRIDGYEGPLSREAPILDLKSATGMIPRFDVPSGAVLTASMLDQPKEVERGDLVAVVIQTSRTHIEAQGIAEQSGRTGAIITVRNSKTGWKFRARVEARGKVLVVPGGPAGLVTEESKS